MFGISFTELIVIVIVALIVIGPQKLPEVARAMGRAYREFNGAMREFQSAVHDTARDAESSPPKPSAQKQPANTAPAGSAPIGSTTAPATPAGDNHTVRTAPSPAAAQTSARTDGDNAPQRSDS